MSQKLEDKAESLEDVSKSKVELIKEGSSYLRGRLQEELTEDSTHFAEEDVQVLKAHGIYEQDDRDLRQQLKKEGKAKLYSFMIRCKNPGGILTPEQYLAEDDVASRYANGSLRITTRQDFQLHGVLKHNLKKVLRAINEKLITTLGACGDVERNIMCCPAPAEDRLRSQIESYARLLSDHLLPRTGAYYEVWLNGDKVVSTEPETEPLYGKAYLPRKFKTGIAFPGDNCIDIYSQDIGIVAMLDGEELSGFNILVGGGQAMTHGIKTTFPRQADPIAFVKPDQLIPAVETIVSIQRDYGDRTNRKHARMKYVVEEWGVAKFKAEIEERLGYELPPATAIQWEGVDDHLGWRPQNAGHWYLGVYVENGRIEDSEAVRLKTGFRRLVETFRPGIRLTPQQNILFTDIAGDQRTAVDDLLREHNIAQVSEVSNTLRYAMACPALPTCGLALSDAERVLPSIVRGLEREIAKLGLEQEKIWIRMTGCPNGCTRPYLGDLGFVGRTLNAYNVYVGGDFEGTRLNQLYAEMIPTGQLVNVVLPLLVFYKEERQPGERFGDFCHRVGVDALSEFSASHEQTDKT